ncbi:hypothetical protein BLAC_07045 [Bifidobacterium animalis subsp. lactis ATCC 27673]|uniref:hypothetical protein n=1 Tax=Bifidobacterium animalis TaxID=28025 RepID=UPI0003B0DF4A|nr:hypothetical protein [Bifidobacterium animalis]AGW85580.1 hypothetical protein BLAC_07045 [Bifidobacterium animalis subsp. lactis ATCC 27673]KOA44375.1 hypothetical protein BAAA27673_07690 [Bifidobacterium animalis subsp. lactis ATCC 27673]UBZ01280.1 hypothetical protein LDH92_07095 [Bifidobacterium animalis subsp. lactis]
MDSQSLASALRAWARSSYPTEAGTELLIRSGRAIYEGAPWITKYGSHAAIDPQALLAHTGAWSGGEQRLIRIAASLLGGEPANLAEDIPGLDRHSTDLVLAAIAHAAGSHEDTTVTTNSAGQPTGFTPAGSLYPWPEES